MAQSELEQLTSLVPEPKFTLQRHLPGLYPMFEKPLQRYGGPNGGQITPQEIKYLFQLHLNTLDFFAATRPQVTTTKELEIRARLMEKIRNIVAASINFETDGGKEAAEIWLDMLSQGEREKLIDYSHRTAAEAESARIQKTIDAARQIIERHSTLT